MFFLSCIGCSAINDKRDNNTQETAKTPTAKLGIESGSKNKIDPSTSLSQQSNIYILDSELFLKDKDNKTILKDDLANINPFFTMLDISKKDYREDNGLYFIGNKLTKNDLKSIFSDKKMKAIPNDYSCDFANIGPPITTTNETDLFAASFIFEWGIGLFDEISIGEYQSSKIYVWNVKGELIKKISYDYGVAPYFTKNGKYLWFEYAEFTLNKQNQQYEITPCISLFDLENESTIFDQKFPGQDINIGGYNNSSGLFGFTVSKSNNEYQIYYFNDLDATLYYRHFTNQNMTEDLTIEKDFIRKKLN